MSSSGLRKEGIGTIDVDGYATVSSAELKALRETAEDRMYWKGRAEGLEYAIDTLQSVFELISKERQ